MNIFGRLSFFITLLNFVILWSPAHAQSSLQTRGQASTILEEKDTFLVAHEAITSSLLNLSNGLDSYFGDIKSLEQKNGTNFRISNISTGSEGRGIYNVTHFNLRFKLPNLEKKFQFSFDRTNDSKEGLAHTSKETTRKSEPDEENFLLAGISSFQDILGVKTRLTPGVKISNPLSLYSKFDTWREIEWTQKFKTLIFHRMFIDSLSGTGQSAIINFDYNLNRFLLFRLANDEVYRDINNSLDVSHGPSLFYKLNDYNALSANYRTHFINHPSYHLNYHFLSLSHRHAFYKNIWYIELIPGLTFHKDNNFKGDTGFTLKLEMIFG